MDDRYSESSIVTHSGWKLSAISVTSGDEILAHIQKANLSKGDVIAVDELFMIEGAAAALISAYCKGYNVVVSTLDLSAQLTAFEEVNKLLPWATHITKCTAVCTMCGNDAQYTLKKRALSGKHKKQIIEIGGKEKYEPRCFKHHPLIKLK